MKRKVFLQISLMSCLVLFRRCLSIFTQRVDKTILDKRRCHVPLCLLRRRRVRGRVLCIVVQTFWQSRSRPFEFSSLFALVVQIWDVSVRQNTDCGCRRLIDDLTEILFGGLLISNSCIVAVAQCKKSLLILIEV